MSRPFISFEDELDRAQDEHIAFKARVAALLRDVGHGSPDEGFRPSCRKYLKWKPHDLDCALAALLKECGS